MTEPGNDTISILGRLTDAAYKNALREVRYERSDDTRYGLTFVDHLAVFESLGFRTVLEESFDRDPIGATQHLGERFVVLYRPDGILGTAESYGPESTNRSNLFYNWRPYHPGERTPWTGGGGGYRRGVWVGEKDVREGLREHLNKLHAAGEFVRPWIEVPSIYLLGHSQESHDFSAGKRPKYDAAGKERWHRLPESVRTALGDPHVD